LGPPSNLDEEKRTPRASGLTLVAPRLARDRPAILSPDFAFGAFFFSAFFFVP